MEREDISQTGIVEFFFFSFSVIWNDIETDECRNEREEGKCFDKSATPASCCYIVEEEAGRLHDKENACCCKVMYPESGSRAYE